MQKLNLLPDRSGYSVQDGEEVISVKLDGGLSKYRRDVLNSSSSLTVQFTLTASGYRYLRDFYRVITEKGALPFLIDLIIDEAELTEHTAYFVPGTMKLQSQSGLQYVVSTQLEVQPLALTGYENEYIYIYQEFGENWEFWLNYLQTIVNEDWPEVL